MYPGEVPRWFILVLGTVLHESLPPRIALLPMVCTDCQPAGADGRYHGNDCYCSSLRDRMCIGRDL